MWHCGNCLWQTHARPRSLHPSPAPSPSPPPHLTPTQAKGLNGVYVPLLVDDMPSFLATFTDLDWVGLSVTIPHKQAALAGAAEADPVAAQIGAVNTLVRQADGGLRGYNTDWLAAVAAIEKGLNPGGCAGGVGMPTCGGGGGGGVSAW